MRSLPKSLSCTTSTCSIMNNGWADQSYSLSPKHMDCPTASTEAFLLARFPRDRGWVWGTYKATLKACYNCRGLVEEGESTAKQTASRAKKATRKAGNAVEESDASDIGSKAQEAVENVQVARLHPCMIQRPAIPTHASFQHCKQFDVSQQTLPHVSVSFP